MDGLNALSDIQTAWTSQKHVTCTIKALPYLYDCGSINQAFKPECVKGDSNPNYKYILSERTPWTMNFDTSIIKIGWKMGKLWAFEEFNMANI